MDPAKSLLLTILGAKALLHPYRTKVEISSPLGTFLLWKTGDFLSLG
jgi:hypothetical protein